MSAHTPGCEQQAHDTARLLARVAELETKNARLRDAMAELVAEIDAGNVGRLTVAEGVKAYDESFGTQLARAALEGGAT